MAFRFSSILARVIAWLWTTVSRLEVLASRRISSAELASTSFLKVATNQIKAIV
jgi:hypothetical protein